MSLLPRIVACVFFTFARSVVTSGEAAETGAGAETVPKQIDALFDFATNPSEPAWVAVNDDVMGGISRGSAQIREGTLQFRGMLSLENNGGFSSIRSRGRTRDLSAFTHLVLRVKGDGRTYRLTLGSNAEFRRSRISYQAEFSTQNGAWNEVVVPFARFLPTYRGESLPGPPLDLARIEEFGLMLADGQPGAFALDLAWIRGEPAQRPSQPGQTDKH